LVGVENSEILAVERCPTASWSAYHTDLIHANIELGGYGEELFDYTTEPTSSR
jgi:hypothetical protein